MRRKEDMKRKTGTDKRESRVWLLLRYLVSFFRRRRSISPLHDFPDGFVCPYRKAILIRSDSRDWSRYEWVHVQSHMVVELTYVFGEQVKRRSQIQELIDEIELIQAKVQDLREGA